MNGLTIKFCQKLRMISKPELAVKDKTNIGMARLCSPLHLNAYGCIFNE